MNYDRGKGSLKMYLGYQGYIQTMGVDREVGGGGGGGEGGVG